MCNCNFYVSNVLLLLHATTSVSRRETKMHAWHVKMSELKSNSSVPASGTISKNIERNHAFLLLLSKLAQLAPNAGDDIFQPF